MASCEAAGSQVKFRLPVSIFSGSPRDLGVSIFTQEFQGLEYIVDKIDDGFFPLPGS
jgi:hypothetical protein